MDPYKIILMPWITEKSLEQRRVATEEIGYFQNNNRLEFIVRREASKADIKAAVEELLRSVWPRSTRASQRKASMQASNSLRGMMLKRPHSS